MSANEGEATGAFSGRYHSALCAESAAQGCESHRRSNIRCHESLGLNARRPGSTWLIAAGLLGPNGHASSMGFSIFLTKENTAYEPFRLSQFVADHSPARARPGCQIAFQRYDVEPHSHLTPAGWPKRSYRILTRMTKTNGRPEASNRDAD